MFRKPEWMSEAEWKTEKRWIVTHVVQSVVSVLLLAVAIIALLK